jgi:transposase
MDIVGAFDLHRKQITFDYIEMQSGEVHRGKIQPADRENLRLWLDGFTERFPAQHAAIAVEATTGWRFVVEELRRAGASPIWPTQRRPSHCEVARSAPRATASMPGICRTYC